MIVIRRFRESEASILMEFIHNYWAKDHILSQNRGLLDWQHADGGEYTVIAAWDGDRPIGVLGYIPTRRFDPSLAGSSTNVLWLALWKVREDVSVTGLGLRLLQALRSAEPNAAIGVVGIDSQHPPMYKALGYDVGELRQHVLFNPDIEPRLAALPNTGTRPIARSGEALLAELFADTIDSAGAVQRIGDRASRLPVKSPVYFRMRYLEHPFYRYRIFALCFHGSARGMLAVRVAEHEGQRVMRVVDWYGDEQVLGQAGPAFEKLLREEGAEYADFWQYGIDRSHLDAAGFARVEHDGPLVVPTLFEPFLRSNRRLLFAMRTRASVPFVLVRADGDQDRPNRLPTDN